MSISLVSNAKLNLALSINYKRSDGYHDISSIIQEIDLHDEKLIHSHRFVLFDRPKPPKNIQGNINFKISVNFLH